MRHWLILDVATAPLPDAETYLEGTIRAPKNYKDEQAIADYIAEKQAERLQMAAIDIDLARITGVAEMSEAVNVCVTCRDEKAERRHLAALANDLSDNPTIITFGGFNFDLPLIQRRARYLGVNFPKLNLDRFRSPHIDLCEELSDRNPQRRRSLEFYAKRLGMGITKTLSGAEEAHVPETRQWEELKESLIHDVTATYQLAQWMGYIETPSPDAELVGL
jgi:DNA polymerase elongation subunit (family B)